MGGRRVRGPKGSGILTQTYHTEPFDEDAPRRPALRASALAAALAASLAIAPPMPPPAPPWVSPRERVRRERETALQHARRLGGGR